MDERANERAKLIEALQDEVRGDLSDGSHPFNARQEEIYFERLELFANRVADFEEALKEAGGEDFDVRQNTAFTDIDLLAAQELVGVTAPISKSSLRLLASFRSVEPMVLGFFATFLNSTCVRCLDASTRNKPVDAKQREETIKL